MRLPMLALLLACGASAPSPERPTASNCPGEGLAVRVLGSGGPIVDDERASAGYVVLLDGRPRLLVDAGGGVALRLAQAGVAPRNLDGLLVSHTHVDHTADLIALLKSASFATRSAPMTVLGPSGDDAFPAIGSFLEAQLGEGGAWRYLGGYLRAEGRPFRLAVEEVDVTGAPRTQSIGPLRVHSVGVPHGPVPALGFLVEAAGASIAFGGDQRLDDARFAELARGADLLIAHHAIPEDAEGVAANLHAKPSQIGAFASDGDIGHLVLSHHMARSLARLDESLELIGARFGGEVTVAEDLDCFAARPR